jgi:hypothetical protein
MSLLPYFLILGTILNKLDFFSPESLVELYKDSPIKYNILNMGDVPYFRSIIGWVVKAEPYDGCEPL